MTPRRFDPPESQPLQRCRASLRPRLHGQPPFVQNDKATPLMVGGTLYVNTPSSVGAAYDARTGALKWAYNPKSYEAGTTTMSLRWNQRGVAYWTDGVFCGPVFL